MLKGKQFFSWELVPIVEAANAACGDIQSCAATAALLVTLNNQSDADQVAASPPTYTEVSSLWQTADSVLAPFAGNASVVSLVSNLADDPKAPPGPSWMAPAAVGVGILAAMGLGYWWTRK